MGCVYKITLSSGKSYIGYTRNTLLKRFSGHKKAASKGSKLLFHKAIRKHGSEDAHLEVIFESGGEALLLAAEVEAIKSHRTIAPSGYNLTSGGERSWSHHPASVEKMRQAAIGKARRTGTKHTEASKVAMRIAKLGGKLSEETRARMSVSRKKFYSDPAHIAKVSEERKSRQPDPEIRRIFMSVISAIGHAKRAAIPFSVFRP